MRKQFAALLFLTSIARAAAPAPQQWTEVNTPHFLVISDASEKEARHVASQFERLRAVFHVLFPSIAADTGQITILAFKDKKGLHSVEPATFLAKGQTEPAGIFLRASDSDYILLRLDVGNGQDHPYANVYREYARLLTSKSVALPLWLSEGIAEFYENTDIDDKIARVGQPSDDDVKHLSDDNDLYIRHQVPLPLTTVLAVDRNSPYYRDGKNRITFNAESWAFTHFLVVNDHNDHTHRLDDYFANLAKGQDSLTAAQNAFGDLKKLEAALAFYIKEHLDFYNPQYRYSYIDLPMTSTVDETSSKPISVADADATRAAILFYGGRKDEALALLNDTLRDDPKNALAHETMGYIKLHDGDFAAARTWYDQAVQLDSQSYLAQYYSAALALRAGDTSNAAAIEASLLAAIRLNPSFAPAYDSLAQFYSSSPDKLAEAHKLSAKAVELDPSNVSYLIHAANILLVQQQPDKAIKLLKQAEAVATNPADLAKVRSRRLEIEQDQVTIAQYKAEHPNGEATIQASGEITFNTPADPAATTTHADSTPPDPQFPMAPPTGPQHTASGIVRNVNCYYPAILSLDLESSVKSVAYFMRDYQKVEFFNMNFVPKGPLDPCKDIDGMKATIRYTDVTDKLVAGQIVRIELTK